MPQVDIRVQGMQSIADNSINRFVGQFEKVEDGYYEKAQEVADRVSQGLFDMASNRPLFEAVQHNLAVLMTTVETVDGVIIPKRSLKPKSLKLLQMDDVNPSSKRALEAGK